MSMKTFSLAIAVMAFLVACAAETGGVGALEAPLRGDAHTLRAPDTQIAAATATTCVVRPGGTVACWGSNGNGEVGTGSNSPSRYPTPVTVPGLSGVVAVASDSYGMTFCALTATGEVWCWGRDREGRLGRGTTGTSIRAPSPVVGISNATQIAVGESHACALLADHSTWCWGENARGQLGDGTNVSSPVPVQQRIAVGATLIMAESRSISAGGYRTCATDAAQVTRCWGRATDDAIGDQSLEVGTNVPVGRPGPGYGFSATGSSASRYATCSIVGASRQVYCVGTGGLSGRGPIARLAVGAGPAHRVSVGPRHGCAVRIDGSVSCWGGNSEGELGDGTTTSRGMPTTVPAIADGASVVAGASHTCLRHTDGRVSCWGSNNQDQLGDGSTAPFRATPGPVAGLALGGRVEVSAGDRFVCARRAEGTVDCEGANPFGELGYGVAGGSPSSTRRPFMLDDARQLDLGQHHACAVRGAGTIDCWGGNDVGQLGLGTISLAVTSPQPVVGISGVTQVDASGSTTCAIGANDSVHCWGDGTTHQFATGAGPGVSAVPVPVGVWGSQVSVGGGHVCAITPFGNVRCWGRNDRGQLGNGSIGGFAPTSVANMGFTGPGPVEVQLGARSSCALVLGGTVRCWGANDQGQLGNGTLADSALPTTVALTDVVDLAVGSHHACVLRADGEVRCWGDNDEGQFGAMPARRDYISAVSTNLGPAVSIDASGHQTCVLRQSGEVECVGVAEVNNDIEPWDAPHDTFD